MKRLLSILVSLRLTVVCLLLLMVLVLWGTIYQAEYGLYAAQERFFASWFLLIGGVIPFPGALLVLWVLFVNLLISMLFHFQYGLRTLGLVTIHFGLLLLLAGGWVTYVSGQESFLTLREGEGANVSSAYHEWELSIWRAGETTSRDVYAIDESDLQSGASIPVSDLGLSVTVEDYHRHCKAFRAVQPGPDAPLNRSGITRFASQPRNPDPEADQPGLVVSVRAEGADDRAMMLFSGDPGPTLVDAGDQVLAFQLRRRRVPLPVVVQLRDFEKSFYPNSEIPRHFSSDVKVFVGEMVRDVTISMNQPFRYGPYTFYQHAYGSPSEGREVSTFAIARNVGRRIPYAATGITVVGLVIHFMGQLLPARSKKRKRGRA